MIPQIAERLIKRFSHKEDTVLDPFCGSGGVLLESALNERFSVGFDVNPLAYHISKVKVTLLDMENLNDARKRVLSELERVQNHGAQSHEKEIPEVSNLGYWFKDYVIRDLAKIKHTLYSFDREPLLSFFRVVLSNTVFAVANLDKKDNPYFPRTLKGGRLDTHKPDAFIEFKRALDEAYRCVRDLNARFERDNLSSYGPIVHLDDSRKMQPTIQDMDVVITSPPYGEEKNTMSYQRFAKLSAVWMGYTQGDLSRLNKLSLGFVQRDVDANELDSATLLGLLSKLTETRPGRSKEVFSFFYDFNSVIASIAEMLKNRGYVCVVIGNRTANGLPVENDKITIELAATHGLKHVDTYYREIPKKVLPRRDYKVELINRESIVILRKEG